MKVADKEKLPGKGWPDLMLNRHRKSGTAREHKNPLSFAPGWLTAMRSGMMQLKPKLTVPNIFVLGEN